jgi:hypothetical protein
MPLSGFMDVMTELPTPWPPAEPVALIRSDEQTHYAEIIATPRGSFMLRVHERANDVLWQWESQPVAFSSHGMVIVAASWQVPTMWVSLSNLELRNVAETREIARASPLAAFPAGTVSPKAVDVPDSLAVPACQPWIDRRAKKFSQPRPAKAGHRAKTNSEIIADLTRSADLLYDASDAYGRGREHMLGLIAAEIRALVCWREDEKQDKTLSPLLLRAANIAKLPLPVFATHPQALDAAHLDKLIQISTGMLVTDPGPSARQSWRASTLMDLQAALRMPIVSSVGQPGEHPQHPLVWFLYQYANNMGSSHYDDFVSDWLDSLSKLSNENVQAHVNVILATGEAVAELTRYVLRRLSVATP